MLRHHPILASLLALLLSATIALAIFLGTFDLNQYREELQRSLAKVLDRPVALGEARLSFSSGPAFDFADISIGPVAGRTDGLQATHLLLKLDWDDLLQGQITFSEIILEQPQLALDIPPTGSAEKSAAAVSTSEPGALGHIQVRALTIHNGSLHLTDRRQAQAPQVLKFFGLNARLRGDSLSRSIDLDFSGYKQQEGQGAPFSISGRITPTDDLRQWRQCVFDLALNLESATLGGLLENQIPRSWPVTATGQISLHANVKGSLMTGLEIKIGGRGDQILLQLPNLWAAPQPLHQLHLQGMVTQRGDTLTLSGGNLALNDLALSGQLAFTSRDSVPWITATLASSTVSLRALQEILPVREAFPQARRLRKGTLQCESLQLDAPLADLNDTKKILSALQLQLSLRQTSIQLEMPTDIEDLSANLTWDKGRLGLTDGRAMYENLPLLFSGHLETPWEEDFPLDLALNGTIQSQTLLALTTKSPSDGLTVVGPLPFQLRISGTRQMLLASLLADLTQVGSQFREAANKPVGLPGHLDAEAEITPEQIRLKQGRLQLGPLELAAQGTLSQQKPRPFALDLAVHKLDLQASRPYLPLLEHLEARGAIDLSYKIKGSNGTPTLQEGLARVHGGGVHLTRIIADLNDIHGDILLSPDGAESRNLRLKLGSSPLEVQAKVASFRDPSVDILVKGEAVRSDDVIFHNDQAYLRQLDGHLSIDRRGIFFAPVKVKLDGGTEATVSGAVTNFSAPQVDLDIEADYGNIDEVIALWNRPKDNPPPPPKKTPLSREPRVSISVVAHKGQLGNLRFEQARGEISLRQGTLTIFPLQFAAGTGRCQGQVAVDLTMESPPLLKMSGHLEHFDASFIYHELLKRKGLVSGTLQGDFYLEGLAGKRFLDTANGGFSFTVDQGVLRKFQFLSKVFSIFNVSQILTFKLPDMDTEGMPFTTLKASAAMNKEILSTNDLFIESTSMNLSLIGDLNLKEDSIDMVLGVKPLRTVDQVVTNIPIAGWLLTGDEKALITAQFEIKGKSSDPEVTPIPITSVSATVLGIFKRILGLPGKVVSDVGDMIKSP